MSLRLVGSLVLCLWASAALGRSELIDTARGPDTAVTLVNAEGGIMAYDGGALPGVNVGITTRISDRSPLYMGAELGFFIATANPAYGEFPLLGSLYYQFEPARFVHPLLGVLAGPVISTGGNESTVRFGAFFRPGVNFELGDRAVLNVEGRFGVVGSTFVFLPEAGVIFPI